MTGQCATLWIGDRLGPVERACFRSILRHGHALALYCYRKPSGVPRGVEVRDASEILSADKIFYHCSGSVAPFADWFRLELQRRGAGTWVDSDVYLLRPIEADRPYYFGREDQALINNAVLRLPAGSRLLELLLDVFSAKRVPWWLPLRDYVPALARRLVRGRADLSRMPFGTTGPDALTAYAGRLGLADHAFAPEVLNPVRWQDAHWIRDPRIGIDQVITERTVALHLWNDRIKTFKEEHAPMGSFLARLQQEGR